MSASRSRAPAKWKLVSPVFDDNPEVIRYEQEDDGNEPMPTNSEVSASSTSVLQQAPTTPASEARAESVASSCSHPVGGDTIDSDQSDDDTNPIAVAEKRNMKQITPYTVSRRL